MSLTLYNTLTRRKDRFDPIDPANVRMYVCGPTVYDYAHIGNARPIIVFDVLFRLLRHIYGDEHVTYVRNITDVDDKINARAAEEGVSIRELTERTAKQFHEDIAALGVLTPEDVNEPGKRPRFVEPRATEHIDEMKALCETLVEKGHAYVAEGHVLFDVSSMPDYGRLSNRSLDEMEAGARVEVAPYKKGPMDFVLWKPSKEGEPGWPSPCGIGGQGRPGWHIECSAMSDRWLWDEVKDGLSAEARARPHQFDIHGGGIDLTFPHHENEIAQSRCAHGTAVMANVWMHNGFLQVEGEKMSKSLGNFITIHELLEGWRGYAWPGQVIRYAMLMTHYRQPIDFSQNALEQASIALSGFATFGYPFDDETSPSQEFLDALSDDLNTPRAITELHRLLKDARDGAADIADRMTRPDVILRDADHKAARELAAGLRLLGIDIRTYDPNWADEQAQSALSVEDRQRIEVLIAARLEARKAKNWAESDRIRDELAGMGIQLKDSKDSATGEITTTWEVMR